MSDNDRTPEELPTEPEDKPLSIAEEIATEVDADDVEAVSYTHLTLPTKRIV